MLAGNMLTYVIIKIWHHASLASQQSDTGVLLNHIPFLALSFLYFYFTVSFFSPSYFLEDRKVLFKTLPSSNTILVLLLTVFLHPHILMQYLKHQQQQKKKLLSVQNQSRARYQMSKTTVYEASD